MATTIEAAGGPAPLLGRRRTAAFAVVALAFVMDLLDGTIVNIAIPSIRADLGASYADVQWLSAGYALAFAVLLITGGRLGDIAGYKRLFLIGVAGFTVASLLSGLAWAIPVLVAARLLQGMTAALMAPQVISLMQVMYPPEERAGVGGLFGALGGLAATLGPIIGGLLIQWNIAGLDWRPIFLINVPVGIFAFVAGVRVLPDARSPHPLRLDLVGTALIVVALGLLVFPLIQGRDLDWPAWGFVMMAASVPVFVLFWRLQLAKARNGGSPLVMPALFRTRTFLVGLLINSTFQMALLGFLFTLTLLLQIGLGYSVLAAALTGIPTAIGISVSIAVLAPKLVPVLGRNTLTAGIAVMAAGIGLVLWPLRAFGLGTNGWVLAPGLLVVGLGMGLVMGLMFVVTLKDVDATHAGSASGTLSAANQLGGAVGIALIGLVLFGTLSAGAGAAFDQHSAPIRAAVGATGAADTQADAAVTAVRTCFVARISAKDPSAEPAACSQVQAGSGQASGAVGRSVANTAKLATADDFEQAFAWTMALSGVLLVVCLVLAPLLPRRIEFSAPTL
jgi:EmrB/QacA subfamily drug resistance transporter